MDDPTDFDWRLLARYLHGQCDETEVPEVRAWLEADPTRRQVLYDLQWLLSRLDTVWAEVHPDAAYSEVERRLDEPPMSVVPPQPAEVGDAGGTVRPRRARFVPRAAAAIAACLVVGGALYHISDHSRGPAERSAVSLATAAGQKTVVRLGDAALVVLGFDSRLELLPGLCGQRREVFLDGMAAFDVTTNAKEPFLVRTRHLVVSVRGTRFGVSAYAEDATAEVATEEGEVAVRLAEAPGDSVLLRAGDVAHYREGDGRIGIRHEAEVHRYLAWRDGRLVFENEPVRSAVRQLERWYGTQIILGDSTLATRRITASLEQPTLQEVLEVLSIALDLVPTRRDEAILLVPARP
jgi:transmembrane sensor